MLRRFPPVEVGGLFYFVGEMNYGDRTQQIERIISLLADAEPPGAPQASPSDRGEGESPPEADTIQTAGEKKQPEAPDQLPDYVTLDQAAALVNRTASGLRHDRQKGMPSPRIKGRKGESQ